MPKPALVLVVAACMATCVSIALVYGLSAEAAELVVFSCILARLSLVDIERRVIPDSCIVAALLTRIAFLCFALAVGAIELGSLAYYVLSALGVGAVLVLLVFVADSAFGAESMGGGDLKLYCVAAFYFGWQLALFVIAASCLFSLVAAALRRLAGAHGSGEDDFLKGTLPFGPSIALGCAIAMIAIGCGF